MRLLQRKPVRALLALLAIVVVAVVAVKVFLPAEKIRDLALAQARQKLGREITVGEVSVSLRGGLGVRLADFAVHNPDGFGGDPLLTTAGLDLKLAVRPLLHGEIQVHRLVLDTPRLNLVRRADGSDNFTFPASGEKPAGGAPGAADGGEAPPPLSVASLTVSSGRVAYTDEGAAPDGGDLVARGGLFRLTDTLGISLLLNTFEPHAAHAPFNSTGIRGTYLFAELQASKVDSFDSEGFDLSDLAWNAGLMLEF